MMLKDSDGTALANAKKKNHVKCVAILEVDCHLQSIGGLLQKDDGFSDLFQLTSPSQQCLPHSKCIRVRLHPTRTRTRTHTRTRALARTNTQAAKAFEAKAKAEKEADVAKGKVENEAANSAAAEEQTTEEKAAKEAAAEAKAVADKAAAEKAEPEKYATEEAAKKQVCAHVCEERELVGWYVGHESDFERDSFALPYIAGAATGVEEMVQRAG